MAMALTGVHRSHPTLATAPVSCGLDASAAAGLRATALARVPPNQAARPRSCRDRDRVFLATVAPSDRVPASVPDARRGAAHPWGWQHHWCATRGAVRSVARGAGSAT